MAGKPTTSTRRGPSVSPTCSCLVVKTVVYKVSAKSKARLPRTLTRSNKWLLKNAAKVDAHAKESTKRLIGRESA